MAKISKTTISPRTEYSVLYSNMAGVDFSGDGSDISRNRFSYLENMYRDYDGDGAGVIESIPGFRKITALSGSCNGLYSYKNTDGSDIIAAHISDKLYEFNKNDIDSVSSPIHTSGLNNSESSAFVFGDSLYVLDGTKIFKISSSYKGAISNTDSGIYIPTTYINEKETEQRNLLTRSFIEKYIIGSCDTISFGSRGLKYVVTDEEKKLCKITGIDNALEKSLCIPSRAKIGDTYYSINEIDVSAFENNTKITSCIIARGVVKIGSLAFFGCSSLKSVIFSDTVSVLGTSAFGDCHNLESVHFGAGISNIGANAFNSCYLLNSVSYSKGADDFSSVIGTEALGEATITYNHTENSAVIGIPVMSPCIGVESVTLGDESVSFTQIVKKGLCSMIKINLDDKALAEGKTVTIHGLLAASANAYAESWEGFVASGYSQDAGTVADTIQKCTVCTVFDGRVFLSGNPAYPGYVFYSSYDKNGDNNPLYFGELNYFRDGAGNTGITSMLKTSDALAVFKEFDDGAGSIFYHTPKDISSGILQKIYPVSYTHHGFCAKGASVSFFDDPVFISEKGISALEKPTINLERSIVTRSGNINPKLLKENIGAAKLAVWRGYLVVCTGENFYLADSRSTFIGKEGTYEYEWYFLSGIGGYKNDSTVYKYASVAHEGYFIHEDADKKTDKLVMSALADGKYVYYVTEGDKNYEVYPTEEKSGGEFLPATHILALGELLLFSDNEGNIYVFNNDKRGIAPPFIKEMEGYSEEEYTALFGRRIHPYFYSFCSHAPRYALTTIKDNCKIPHLLKNTVKHSLILKCRASSSGNLYCEVGTDKDGYSEICSFPNSDIMFTDMNFSSLAINTSDIFTVAIREKEKSWIEKQITLYTDEFASPFGLYTIAYRFFIKGKIKNK